MNPLILNYLLNNNLDRNGKPNKPEPEAVQPLKVDNTVKKAVPIKKQ